MKKEQENPEGVILYPKTVVELLHIRRQFNRGIPIFTVFDVEAQNYKYGKEAYCHIIKNQIKEVFDFTLRNEKETMPQYYDETFDKGIECKITEVNQSNNFVYYYFNHEVETKILNELLEYLQTNTIGIEQTNPTHRKQGRPITVVHEASYYLYDKELLQFLIDNYRNTKPRNFNQLLSVLADIEINQLKPATNKEYNKAFGKALNVKQAQSNFDNYFNKTKIEEIFEPIKATIKTYLEQ